MRINKRNPFEFESGYYEDGNEELNKWAARSIAQTSLAGDIVSLHEHGAIVTETKRLRVARNGLNNVNTKEGECVMGDYKIPFGSYMNRDKDDNWDVKESIERYTREAHAFVELQTRTTAVLSAAIDNQFKANPQATMNKGAIVTLALGEVKFTADTYQPLKERAEEIIDNDDRFYTVKGKGGGLRRMTDEEFAAWKEKGQTPHDMERDAKKAAKGKKQKTAPVAAAPVAAPASK